METPTELQNWWKCLCELARGRKEVLPLPETELLDCLCESLLNTRVAAVSWEIMQPLGCFAQLVIQPHPEGAPGGGREGGRKEEKGQELLKHFCMCIASATYLCWYAVASVPALCLD